MRELTLEELELISGGTDTTEVDEIVVVADGGDDGGGDFGDWGDWGDWGDQGDFGDGGGDSPPPPDPEPPCPGGPESDGETPQGHELSDIRNAAQEAVDKIAAGNDGWEYGVVIYSLNGQLHTTDAVTQQNNSTIGFNYTDPSFIPTGAHIVGWVHSHPDLGDGSDQGGMSSVDDGARQTMVDNSGGRFSVDSSMMTYVLDNKDDKVHEFNESDTEGSRSQVLQECSGG